MDFVMTGPVILTEPVDVRAHIAKTWISKLQTTVLPLKNCGRLRE